MISQTDEAIVFGSLLTMRAALRAREISAVEIVEAVLRRGDITPRRASDQLIAPFPRELGAGAWVFAQRG